MGVVGGVGVVGAGLPPILKIFVPHTGQRPWVAGRPFFMVICFASLISREVLHLTQYPFATRTSQRI